MTKGLMQLIATGTQDQYITGSPEMSYFKQVYKHPTNFSMESVQTTFISSPVIGTNRATFTCKVPRVGDLLKSVFLSFEMPEIYSSKELRFRWIRNIGNYLIYSYSISADSQLLDTRWGEFNDIWNELSLPADKKETYNRMTGNVPEFINPTSTPVVTLKNNRIDYFNYPGGSTDGTPSISKRRIFIPLDFWFSKTTSLALPLVALQYQVINITIELRGIEDLYQIYDPSSRIYLSPAEYRIKYPNSSVSIGDFLKFGGGGPNIVDLNAYLECEYVFLDDPERNFIATNSFDFLIENIYRTETTGIKNIYTIDMFISNPIKELIWITRRSDIKKFNDWTNLTASIPEDRSKSALNTAKLLWNGKDRIDEKSSTYFNLLQPYQYHTSSPREGIYCYSFALFPEKIQPSGSYNASTIDTNKLYLTMNPFIQTPVAAGPDSTEYTVTVYSIYYNICRIMGGHAGMVFAK